MANSVNCSDCGADLSALARPKRRKLTCPRCGSTKQTIGLHVADSIKVTGVAQRGGKSVGFTESERDDGAAAWAQQERDGSQSFTVRGPAPQGEADTLACCQVLIERLNAGGDNWREPEPGQGDVDCSSRDTGDSSKFLNIQVVHATTDPSFWRNLNSTRYVRRESESLNVFADAMRSAIEHKALDRKIPAEARSGLVLALDATRLPSFGFDECVTHFRRRHGTWVKTCGFQAVWIVGPTASLTWRLDERTGSGAA